MTLDELRPLCPPWWPGFWTIEELTPFAAEAELYWRERAAAYGVDHAGTNLESDDCDMAARFWHAIRRGASPDEALRRARE